jgi:glycosyltransferase involved in cell wall biosynthesis
VLPFPGTAGQQQRVFYTLEALRNRLHVTFLTTATARARDEVEGKLRGTCDEVVVLPSKCTASFGARLWHKGWGLVYRWRTGLKQSNYFIGRVEFAPARLMPVLEAARYDGVLFEYWHAFESVAAFHALGIPCVLDMHNILWQSYARQMSANPFTPRWWKRWALDRYRRREEDAWRHFDALIAINAAEQEYTRHKVANGIPVFYAPMGIDTESWPYSWQPARPVRLAYYGGLGSAHNHQDALRCYQSIMPRIWERHPQAELWLIGSNPPESILSLCKNPRVKVTGFVPNVQEVLKTVTVIVCPWSGTYGFRSRLIEVMSLGVPVVASADAAYGMNLKHGAGIFLEDSSERMAEACLRLIDDDATACQQSLQARRQIEDKYSFAATYGRMAEELVEFCRERRSRPTREIHVRDLHASA